MCIIPAPCTGLPVTAYTGGDPARIDRSDAKTKRLPVPDRCCRHVKKPTAPVPGAVDDCEKNNRNAG